MPEGCQVAGVLLWAMASGGPWPLGGHGLWGLLGASGPWPLGQSSSVGSLRFCFRDLLSSCNLTVLFGFLFRGYCTRPSFLHIFVVSQHRASAFAPAPLAAATTAAPPSVRSDSATWCRSRFSLSCSASMKPSSKYTYCILGNVVSWLLTLAGVMCAVLCG